MPGAAQRQAPFPEGCRQAQAPPPLAGQAPPGRRALTSHGSAIPFPQRGMDGGLKAHKLRIIAVFSRMACRLFSRNLPPIQLSFTQQQNVLTSKFLT